MHRRQSSSKAPSPTVISFPLADRQASASHPPSSTTTPRTAFAEAFVATAPSPKLGFNSRRKASLVQLSSPSRFVHTHRRLLLRLALVVITLGALYKSKAHEHRYVEHAVGRATEHSCRAFPYLARCLSRDPFKGLEYPAAGEGELGWPARRVGGEGGKGRDGELAQQPHPIHLLIREARAKWEAKVARQSRTLEEAVSEYKRRYNQKPPRGFDKWFAWAQAHDVQLPDEYDSIHQRIEPFSALPRQLIQERARKLRDDKDFWMREMGFTVNLKPGQKPTAGGPGVNVNPRPEEILRFIEGIEDLIPVEVNLTMTFHDTPWVVVAGEAKQRHIDAARAHRHVWEKDWDRVDENFSLDGWAAACPARSPIRSAGYFEQRKDRFPAPSPQSFIRDHPAAMDLCSHPDSQGLHGFTAWPGPRPGLLYPLFSFTTSSMHSDLLLPALEQFDHPVGPLVPWSEMKDQVVWRGSTTGSDLTNPHMQTFSQRPRLAKLAQGEFVGGGATQAVGVSVHDGDASLDWMREVVGDKAAMAREWLDVRFAGHPAQCGDEASCARFKEGFVWGENMGVEEQNRYKYVLDVDGNGWSGRFHRLMSSNTLVLKSTIFPEWYTDRIQPWVHYVPIKTDYSDLFPTLAFFLGSPASNGKVRKGDGAHDALAELISREGRRWAETHWRWEDMQSYFVRLVLEYARVMEGGWGDSGMDYEG